MYIYIYTHYDSLNNVIVRISFYICGLLHNSLDKNRDMLDI